MPTDSDSPIVTHVIFAREAPVAAVFVMRSDGRTQLAKWNLGDNSIECGEQYAGNIFFRRCDLSPDGKKLLYFATQPPDEEYDPSLTSTWSAVSLLPAFSPTILWPKGDRLAGGGLFHDDNHIWLNHKPDRAVTHEKYPAPDKVFVNPNGYASGEDYPIYANRIQRDGWRFKQHGDFRFRNGIWIAEVEELCVKQDHTRRYEIEMIMYKIEKRAKGSVPFYRFAVCDTVSGESQILENCNWADWDSIGRLCFTNGPQLLAGSISTGLHLDVDLVADFSKTCVDEVSPAT